MPGKLLLGEIFFWGGGGEILKAASLYLISIILSQHQASKLTAAAAAIIRIPKLVIIITYHITGKNLLTVYYLNCFISIVSFFLI